MYKTRHFSHAPSHHYPRNVSALHCRLVTVHVNGGDATFLASEVALSAPSTLVDDVEAHDLNDDGEASGDDDAGWLWL